MANFTLRKLRLFPIKMKLQILSDLHLEFQSISKIPVAAETLCLLGDIDCVSRTNYERFIGDCALRWQRVLVVAGNHELYNSTFQQGMLRMQEIANFYPNVHFLDNSFIEIDNHHILGCTLWSEIDPLQAREVKRSLNDYQHIRWQIEDVGSEQRSTRKLTIEDTLEKHRESVTWLKTQIAMEKPTVVLTHHAPIRDSASPIYRNSPVSTAFFTDLEYLFQPHVALWAFGHTHWCVSKMYGNTRVVANQRGYPSEIGDAFDPTFIVTV